MGTLGVWLSIRSILAIHAAQAVIDKGWLAKANCLISDAYNSESYKELEPYLINRTLHRPRDTHECLKVAHEDCLHQEAIKLHKHIGRVLIISWVAIILMSSIHSFTKISEGTTIRFASCLPEVATSFIFL